MKDPERTIEQLLAGLRDAEPRPGIEHRILQAVQARATVAPVTFWMRLRPETLPSLAVCLVAVLGVAVSLLALAYRRHLYVPAAESRHKTALLIRGRSTAENPARKVLFPARRPSSRVRSQHLRRETPAPGLGNARLPAPPLPLTGQEKLLLRLAHRRDPEDAAILNRDAQAAQSAEANRQFQQFFEINTTEMRKQLE